MIIAREKREVVMILRAFNGGGMHMASVMTIPFYGTCA